MTYDAVVVGGGPAGSVFAARLASRGRSVVLLERERHPRFHLGESLLPASLGVLQDIGVLDQVRARFLVKRGARFVDGRDGSRAARYAFAEAFQARWDHAFQVPRDAFDELLFRHAGRRGAELREGWEVQRVLREGERAHGVEVRGPDGDVHTLAARYVIDATGREAMTARASRDVERIAHLDRTALFTQVRGAWRDTGEREGDIQIVVLGDETNHGWMWLIPFADGRTSVGAVVSRAWIAAQRESRDRREPSDPGEPKRPEDAEGLFRAAVRGSPTASSMLDGATSLFAPRATSDFSFRVRRLHGPGWLALGDAAGFIDPLFSTGAHLAMHGALRAADVVDQALSSDERGGDDVDAAAAVTAWELAMRSGADLFLGLVQAFYSGSLTPYLFAEPQHPFLRRAVTSLLSGDVFDPTARWAQELRKRFPVQMA